MWSDESKVKHPIEEEWEEQYVFLEALRRTGVVNMWGAGIYLEEAFPLKSKEELREIHLSWITHYDELNQKYGWQK